MIRKERRRYSGLTNEKPQSHKLFHLVQSDFPGLSFAIISAGKLRLDQNDSTPLPLAQVPTPLTGKDADSVDGKHSIQLLLRDGSQSLQNDLAVDSDKKIDGIDISALTDHIYCSEIDVEFSTTSNTYVKCVGFRAKKRLWHGFLKSEIELYSTSNLTAYARLRVTNGSTTVYSNEVSTSADDDWEKKTLSVDISIFPAGDVLEMHLEFRKSAVDINAKIRRIQMFMSKE